MNSNPRSVFGAPAATRSNALGAAVRSRPFLPSLPFTCFLFRVSLRALVADDG